MVPTGVRAKFKCESNEKGDIRLSPVVGGSEENDQFYAATPGGSILLAVVNESAAQQFEVGKEYYVDFSPAG